MIFSGYCELCNSVIGDFLVGRLDGSNHWHN